MYMYIYIQVEMNDSVMCESNGSLLLARVSQLKPRLHAHPFSPLYEWHI